MSIVSSFPSSERADIRDLKNGFSRFLFFIRQWPFWSTASTSVLAVLIGIGLPWVSATLTSPLASDDKCARHDAQQLMQIASSKAFLCLMDTMDTMDTMDPMEL